MSFVIIARDKDDGALRRRNRAAHLEHVATRQDLIIYAGPLIEEGRIVGSIFVFDLDAREAVDAYCADDPYFTAPIFDSIEIYESRWMVPERCPGSLAAEAKKARGARP